MLTLDVNGKQGAYKLNLPTSISEITESYIDEVTSHVKVDANYSLIGIVFKERLSTLILSARRNKKTSKDKLIISPSDIMLGNHISAPNNFLTINTILDLLDGDADAYAKLVNIPEDCYFIEFKLVPNCNIHGAYTQSKVAEFVSPFVTKVND